MKKIKPEAINSRRYFPPPSVLRASANSYVYKFDNDAMIGSSLIASSNKNRQKQTSRVMGDERLEPV
jgi:hypothetical protein